MKLLQKCLGVRAQVKKIEYLQNNSVNINIECSKTGVAPCKGNKIYP